MEASAQSLEELRRFRASVIRQSLWLTLGAALVLMLVGEGRWARGVALGGLASVCNFWIMGGLLPRSVGPQGPSRGWSLASLMGRFILMAAALALAMIFESRVAVGGCIAGLFAVQLTLMTRQVLSKAGGS